MNMQDIIHDMEVNLENHRGVLLLYEEKVKAAQKIFDEAEKALLEEKKKYNTAKDKVDAISMALESLKMGGFATNIPMEKAPVKIVSPEPEIKKDISEKKKLRNLDWKHKNACVIQINEYDNVIDRFRSQNAAARKLNWSQSSISHFMKFSKDEQIRKKGFALVWEY